MGNVIHFPALPQAPSVGKRGCGKIPDFVQFMAFMQEATQELLQMNPEPELSKRMFSGELGGLPLSTG